MRIKNIPWAFSLLLGVNIAFALDASRGLAKAFEVIFGQNGLIGALKNQYVAYGVVVVSIFTILYNIFQLALNRVKMFEGEGGLGLNSPGKGIVWGFSILSTLGIFYNVPPNSMALVNIIQKVGNYGVSLMLIIVGISTYKLIRGTSEKSYVKWFALAGAFFAVGVIGFALIPHMDNPDDTIATSTSLATLLGIIFAVIGIVKATKGKSPGNIWKEETKLKNDLGRRYEDEKREMKDINRIENDEIKENQQEKAMEELEAIEDKDEREIMKLLTMRRIDEVRKKIIETINLLKKENEDILNIENEEKTDENAEESELKRYYRDMKRIVEEYEDLKENLDPNMKEELRRLLSEGKTEYDFMKDLEKHEDNIMKIYNELKKINDNMIKLKEEQLRGERSIDNESKILNLASVKMELIEEIDNENKRIANELHKLKIIIKEMNKMEEKTINED